MKQVRVRRAYEISQLKDWSEKRHEMPYRTFRDHCICLKATDEYIEPRCRQTSNQGRYYGFLQYPSIHIIPSELKGGYFSIDRLEDFAVKCNDHDSRFNPSIVFSDDGYNVAKCMRVVVGFLLATHFGDAIIEEVFCRYRKIIADCISKEKTQFIKVTISMTKIVIYG
ncbi:salicylate carboxymethyltransferase [Quercus suber]|uniref:Salicylate carboxymethyltransferase n=1 Tax=Quercus suber TaxID=58331 RepID=A0AAW0M8C2_QUESU